MKKLPKTARILLIAVLYLCVWGGVSALVGKELLLPSPLSTGRRFIALLGSWQSWEYAGLTLLRIMGGYALGVAGGVLLAVLCARFPFAEALLTPLRSVIKATPVTSFILLALLWLTSGTVPLFIAFLMVLPMVWNSVLTGILQTDRQLLEMARAFHLGRWGTLRHVYVPSLLPGFLSTCTTAMGFAWKSGVAAEILAQPKRSVGYMLYASKLQLETVDLFAWTLLVILLSMLLEKTLLALLKRIRHD